MDVILEQPIFCNPEETKLGTNKTHHLRNHTDIKPCSLKYIDEIKQRSKINALYKNDSIQQQFQICDIQWQHTSKEINFGYKVVDTLSYINGNSFPVDKAFQFSWNVEVEQQTVWGQQWGNGACYVYETNVPNSDVTVKITHDQMKSTSIISVPLSVTKSLLVSVAPKKTAIAQLVLMVSEIVELPFIATIKCISADKDTSEFKIEGSWSGILHKISSSNINVYETEIGIM